MSLKLSVDQSVLVYGKLGVAASTHQLNESNIRAQTEEALKATGVDKNKLAETVDSVVSALPESWLEGPVAETRIAWDYLSLLTGPLGIPEDREVSAKVSTLAGDQLETLRAKPMKDLDDLLKVSSKAKLTKRRAQAIVGYAGKIQQGGDSCGLLDTIELPVTLSRQLKCILAKNPRLRDDGWSRKQELDHRINNLLPRRLGEELRLGCECVCTWAADPEHEGVPKEQQWMHDARAVVQSLDSGTRYEKESIAIILADRSVRTFLHRLKLRQSEWEKLFPDLSETIVRLADFPRKYFKT